MCNERILIHRRIVERILKAIGEGKVPSVAHLEGRLRALAASLDSESTAFAELKFDEVFRANPELVTEGHELTTEDGLACAEQLLQLLDSELDRYRALAQLRPLTAEEKRIGRESLIPLFNALRELVSAIKGNFEEQR